MHLTMPREVEDPLLGEGVGSGPVEVGVRKEAERELVLPCVPAKERAVLATAHYLLTLSNIHSVINGKNSGTNTFSSVAYSVGLPVVAVMKRWLARGNTRTV